MEVHFFLIACYENAVSTSFGIALSLYAYLTDTVDCFLLLCDTVEENTESVDHPMHEACKRGNISFLNDCIRNKVSAELWHV